METDSPLQLEKLLTPETIRLQMHLADPMDVIQKAGELLIASGSVEERYIAAMQQSLTTHGPYMVIIPGIALLHARPEDGVKKVCMSLITLDPPIPFGNPDNDPVSLAFVLGAVDNEQHQEALMALAHLMQDEAAIERLRTSTSIGEVCAIFASAPRVHFKRSSIASASEEVS